MPIQDVRYTDQIGGGVAQFEIGADADDPHFDGFGFLSGLVGDRQLFPVGWCFQ